MSIIKKNISIIVSRPTGEFITVWKDFSFKGFSSEINAGPGECVIELPLHFDYGGNDINEGNDIEITLSDRDTLANPNGQNIKTITIYKGYISLIEREIDGAKESVIVHILGYYTLLGLDILKSADQTTLYSKDADGLTITSGDQSAADIGLIVRTVIDRYRAENVNPKINYNASDIPDTGTTVEYSFEQKTYREALDLLKRMSPVGTYYYVDENGLIKFGAKPTTPTHAFIFGRHFNRVKITKSLEKTRNFFLIWNYEVGGGEIYKHYQDDASILNYGRRVYTENDSGLDASGAADKVGASFIADSKDPEIKVICSIIDNNGNENGYDIESIKPGDTCSFYGFQNNLNELFRDNMLITRVDYYLDRVDIVVEVIKSGMVDWQNRQGKIINQINTGGLLIPESYT